MNRATRISAWLTVKTINVLIFVFAIFGLFSLAMWGVTSGEISKLRQNYHKVLHAEVTEGEISSLNSEILGQMPQLENTKELKEFIEKDEWLSHACKVLSGVFTIFIIIAYVIKVQLIREIPGISDSGKKGRRIIMHN